jgi:zinc transport system permease protein
MLEIFQFDFMIRAFVAGAVIAFIAPMIGIFLVVRRYSLMADTLAHVSLAGVAVGLLIKINPLVTGIIMPVVAAFCIEKLRSTRNISGESLLALFLSGSLAIAIVLLSIAKGFNANLFSFLFGSISTVTSEDLYLIVGLGILVIATILALYKELFAVSFDDELAKASGISASVFNLVLTVLAAITVSLAMRIVGVLLIGALMVIPVIAAIQFGRSFRQTLLLSITFSSLSVFLGLFLSFYLDLASGGTIVVIALVIFLLSLLRQTLKNTFLIKVQNGF